MQILPKFSETKVMDFFGPFLKVLTVIKNDPTIFEVSGSVQRTGCKKLVWSCDHSQIFPIPKLMATGRKSFF